MLLSVAIYMLNVFVSMVISHIIVICLHPETAAAGKGNITSLSESGMKRDAYIHVAYGVYLCSYLAIYE